MSGPLEVGVDARRRHRGVLVSDVVCQDEDVLQMSLRVSDVVIKERFDVEAKPAEHGVGRLTVTGSGPAHSTGSPVAGSNSSPWRAARISSAR